MSESSCKTILFAFFIILFFQIQQIHAATSSKRTAKYLLNKPQCDDDSIHKMELIIAKVATIGPNGRKLPESYAEVKKFCSDTNQMVAKVETFLKECFEKTVRDYAKIFLYTIKRNIRKYCGKKGSKTVRELLKLAPCVNKYIRPYQICSPKYMNKTKQLIGLKDDKLKIHYSCCYFLEGVKCVEDYLDTVPCIRDSREALADMVRTGSSNLFENVCGEYNDQTDACEKLGPAPKPEKENNKHYLTPMTLAIDLLESMNNFTASLSASL